MVNPSAPGRTALNYLSLVQYSIFFEMEHRDELEENTVGQEVSAHAFPSHLPDAPQPFFHPPPVRRRGLLPAPLKAAEEREYLTRCAQGDLEARNVLVEHNLRLVAHIVNNG